MSTDIEPKLVARLEMDQQGKPLFTEEDSHRHYKVAFEVEDAPADAYAATFQLDPSYYDPVRTLRPESDGKFRLETTTWGDYAIVVRLHRSNGEDLVLKEGVARALRRERGMTAGSSAVDEALSYIASH